MRYSLIEIAFQDRKIISARSLKDYIRSKCKNLYRIMQVLKIQLNSLKAFISINCVLYGRMRFNVEKKEIEKLHEDLKSSFKIMH